MDNGRREERGWKMRKGKIKEKKRRERMREGELEVKIREGERKIKMRESKNKKTLSCDSKRWERALNGRNKDMLRERYGR